MNRANKQVNEVIGPGLIKHVLPSQKRQQGTEQR